MSFRKNYFRILSEGESFINSLSLVLGGVRMAELKPKQRELLEAMLANPMMSDVKLAKLLKINNKTVGVWKRLPEFKEELDFRLKEQWKESERIAVAQMRKLASEGCYQANKYILDSLGYAPAQRIEANVSNDIIINIEE